MSYLHNTFSEVRTGPKLQSLQKVEFLFCVLRYDFLVDSARPLAKYFLISLSTSGMSSQGAAETKLGPGACSDVKVDDWPEG